MHLANLSAERPSSTHLNPKPTTFDGLAWRPITEEDLLKLEQTNDQLPELTEVRVKALLQDTRLAIDQLDAQIDRARKLIETLSVQRTQKVTEFERLRVILSPVKKVPAEILVEIFLLCLPCNPWVHVPESKWQQNFGSVSPWKLSHVCSRWRQVVLGEARFWNRVVLSHGRAVDFQSAADMVLRLSATANLHVRVNTGVAWPSQRNELIYSAIERHASRIATLKMISCWKFAEKLISLPSETFTSLSSLELACHGPHLIPSTSVTPALFAKASNLRRVSIAVLEPFIPSQRQFQELIVDMRLPLHQLTHLTFSSLALSPSFLKFLFDRTPNLAECSLCIGKQEKTGPIDTSSYPPVSRTQCPTVISITMPCLRSLELQVPSSDYSLIDKDILPHLVLPALAQLKICLRRDVRRSAPDALMDLVARSSCSITHLTFERIWSDMGYLIENLPSLVSISSRTSVLSSHTLERLTHGKCGLNLETLTCCVPNPDHKMLLQFLEARWSKEFEGRTTGVVSCKRLEYVDVTLVNGLDDLPFTDFTTDWFSNEFWDLQDKFDIDRTRGSLGFQNYW